MRAVKCYKWDCGRRMKELGDPRAMCHDRECEVFRKAAKVEDWAWKTVEEAKRRPLDYLTAYNRINSGNIEDHFFSGNTDLFVSLLVPFSLLPFSLFN